MRVGLSVVAFVVDTGCDISFISYGDACKLNIPLNGLPEKGETHIGNTTFVMSELPVFGLTLESEAGEPVRIDVDHFHVAKTRKKSIADVELAKAIPSILGLDFMRRNRLALHVEPANNLAYFEKIG